jgi:hypothetical protein
MSTASFAVAAATARSRDVWQTGPLREVTVTTSKFLQQSLQTPLLSSVAHHALGRCLEA